MTKGYITRRKPGGWFGSGRPKIVYVGMRCNSHAPDPHGHDMLTEISKKLIQRPASKLRVGWEEVRVYNLAPPKPNQGMRLGLHELAYVVNCLKMIAQDITTCGTVERILIGGVTGPMPMAGAALKALLPKVPIEICNHHVARGRNRLKLCQRL